MNKVVYKHYRTLRDRLAKMVAPFVPKKIRRASPDNYMKFVMKETLSMRGMMATLDSNILVDEESYIENGCRAYFPESLALLEMLWRAKMDVDLEDLDLSLIPDTFSVVWPRMEIEGAPLIGCMVSIYPNIDRAKVVARFGQRYFGHPLKLVTTTDIPDDEIGIHISYAGEKKAVGDCPPMHRCSIPNSFLRDCLRGGASFDAKLRTYRNRAFQAMDLIEEESHQQYVISRLVIHLLVYMQACPEMIADGYPEGRKAREFGSKYCGKMKPTILRAPMGLRGIHASPEAHWRNPHFRSYPRRRDGNKRKGIVAVKGTMVNADIDPRTVKDDKLEVTIA